MYYFWNPYEVSNKFFFDVKTMGAVLTGKTCSSKRRKVTDSMIEHFASQQCAITVNTTMHICDSCRLYSYRPVSVESAQQLAPSDNEMPNYTTASTATSRHDLEEIPAAASLVSTSSRHSNLPDDLRNQNVEVFLELMYLL